ncbi:hypothetical protein H9P43_008651 [Blastocladiella emersonii ATCC 22665]|nr:hypothetical protein H9P43_008651 [Blastocladiella emersonii ATCC 22665]
MESTDRAVAARHDDGRAPARRTNAVAPYDVLSIGGSTDDDDDDDDGDESFYDARDDVTVHSASRQQSPVLATIASLPEPVSDPPPAVTAVHAAPVYAAPPTGSITVLTGGHRVDSIPTLNLTPDTPIRAEPLHAGAVSVAHVAADDDDDAPSDLTEVPPPPPRPAPAASTRSPSPAVPARRPLPPTPLAVATAKPSTPLAATPAARSPGVGVSVVHDPFHHHHLPPDAAHAPAHPPTNIPHLPPPRSRVDSTTTTVGSIASSTGSGALSRLGRGRRPSDATTWSGASSNGNGSGWNTSPDSTGAPSSTSPTTLVRGYDASDTRSTRSGRSFFTRLRKRVGGSDDGVGHAPSVPPLPADKVVVGPHVPSLGDSAGASARLAAWGAEGGDPPTDDDGARQAPVSAVEALASVNVQWPRTRTRSKGVSKRCFNGMGLVQTLTPPPPPPPTDASKPATAAADHAADPSRPPPTLEAVWTVRWSPCGRFLASGGKDGVVRVWAIVGLDGTRGDEPSTPPPPSSAAPGSDLEPPPHLVVDRPWLEFRGHVGDILDLAWNRAGCLASSGTDKTVRVWHPSRPDDAIAVFTHGDFVPAVVFHPTDDWLFLSGCFDGKLRLWSLDEKRLVASADLGNQYVTAVQFARDGRWAVAGTYAGTLAVYSTDGLGLQGQAVVRSNSRRARVASANARPCKITGIEPWPDPAGFGDKLVVASNDSRVRIIDTADLRVIAKLKGHSNQHAQIRAHVTEDARWVVCGSENGWAFVWDTLGVPELRPSPFGGHHPPVSPTAGSAIPAPATSHGSGGGGGGNSRFSRLRTALASPWSSGSNGSTSPNGSLSRGGGTHTVPRNGATPPPATTITGVETFQVSSCTVTSTSIAPLKTRLLLEAAGLLPARWGSADAAGGEAGSGADWTLVAASDQAGAIRLFINLPPAALAVPVPAAAAPAPATASGTETPSTRSGTATPTGRGPTATGAPSGSGTMASTLVRSMSSLADSLRRSSSSIRSASRGRVAADESVEPVPPLPASKRSLVASSGEKLHHHHGHDNEEEEWDNDLVEGAANERIAECPYCGSSQFKDLVVAADGGGEAGGQAPRIAVCCQCMRVVRDPAHVLGM